VASVIGVVPSLALRWLEESTMNRSARPVLAAALAAAVGTAHAADPAKLSVQAGCAVCHAVDKKLVGPSWKEVAARYKGNAGAAALLASRMRKGSTGAWGQVPMAPVDAKTLGDADLALLISWVLKT
jgi:cytochrome c